MELQEILSVSIGTLIVVVISHFAVFWVVRTLYPPAPAPVAVAMPPPIMSAPVEVPVFTPPPVVEQHVTLPTYETPLPTETAPPERKGPPAPEDTSIRRKPGVDDANAR